MINFYIMQICSRWIKDLNEKTSCRRKYRQISLWLHGENFIKLRISTYQEWMKGLPWWFTGKESACQCRKLKFSPLSRNILHGTEQLSLCHNFWACALEPRNATTEATSHSYWSLHALEPVLHNKTSCCSEVWALQLQSSSQ